MRLPALVTVLLAGLLAAPPPAAAQSDNTLIIGIRGGALPFSDIVEGRAAGYTAELCAALAGDIVAATPSATDHVLRRVETRERFSQIRNGGIDLLCGATTETLDRRRFMDFSIPVFVDGATAAVRADAPADLLRLIEAGAGHGLLAAHLEDKRLQAGVLRGTTTEEFVTTLVFPEGPGAAGLKVFQTHAEAFDALAAGGIDAYFVSAAIAAASERPLSVRPEPFTFEPIAIGVRLGASRLRLAVDAALSRAIFDGRLFDTYRRHFGPITDATRQDFLHCALE